MSKVDIFKKLLSNDELKITSLRKEVLDIFLSAKKPLSAYEALSKLKKKRPGAEPPTVYRVIEYFLDKKILHRIEMSNKYVLCAHLDEAEPSSHEGVLFLCKKCLNSFEIMDDSFSKHIKKLSDKHGLQVDESLVEIKGLCGDCVAK